jgi:hypothetical protein
MLLDHPIGPIPLYPCLNRLQSRPQESGLIPDHDAADERLLPLILESHFANRNVELPSESGDERLNAAALLLEGSAAREMELDRQDADHV